MLALYAGSTECCELLAAAGASLMVHKNDWHCNDAHWAAMGDRPKVVLGWLKRRLDDDVWRHALQHPQKQGHSVFHKAAQRGRAGALSWLLDEAAHARADLRVALARDASGRRPSAIAAAAGYDDAARLLAVAEADLDRAPRRPPALARLGVAALATAALALAALAAARRRRS